LRVPDLEVRQPLDQGGEGFRPATVERSRQPPRMMDDLAQLAQQTLGDLHGALIAGGVEGSAELVRQATLRKARRPRRIRDRGCLITMANNIANDANPEGPHFRYRSGMVVRSNRSSGRNRGGRQSGQSCTDQPVYPVTGCGVRPRDPAQRTAAINPGQISQPPRLIPGHGM
jgi:hypothetical protein